MSLPVLPLLVAVTFFMENLDGTVIATALPQMGASFGVGPADLSIGMTAYLLTLAVFIPVSGWVADRFGARTVFTSAIFLFTLASLLCGLSNSVSAFVLARIVQGIGGAMMVPVGRMVVMRSTPKPQMMRAISTITWPGLVAPVLGPPVGGFITTYATWRWIFWLNLPIGLVALALAVYLVPNERGHRRPFDYVGFALSGAALSGLMYGLDELGRPGANWRIAAAILLVSAGLGILAVRHARRHRHPMLDLGPTRIPTFAVNIWSGSLFRIAFNAMPFLVPLLLQVGFGMTAFDAGLLILIGAAGDLAAKTITVRLFRAAGFRPVLIANSILGALALLSTLLLTRGSSHWEIAAVLLGYGLTRSLQFSAGATLALADIPPSLAAPASTLLSMIMQMTSGMGVAFGAIVLHLAVWLHGGNPDTPGVAEARMKNLTGGKKYSARGMRENFSERDMTAHMWMGTNYRPAITGTDKGIWRRMHMIHFAQTVPEEKADKTLKARMRAEIPGFLAVLAQGYRAWRKMGLAPPASVLRNREEYRAEQDVVGRFLLEETEPGDWVSYDAVYRRYAEWLKDQGKTGTLSKIKLNKQLEKKGLKEGRTTHARGWAGIALKIKVSDPEGGFRHLTALEAAKEESDRRVMQAFHARAGGDGAAFGAEEPAKGKPARAPSEGGMVTREEMQARMASLPPSPDPSKPRVLTPAQFAFVLGGDLLSAEEFNAVRPPRK